MDLSFRIISLTPQAQRESMRSEESVIAHSIIARSSHQLACLLNCVGEPLKQQRLALPFIEVIELNVEA